LNSELWKRRPWNLTGKPLKKSLEIVEIEKVDRHPLNVVGDFYVENEMCICCDAPRDSAPDLIDYDAEMHCYFKRQPETSDELDAAVDAVCVSCVEAVRYDGDDPIILEKIDQKQKEYASKVPPENANWKTAPWTKFVEFINSVFR